MLLQRAAALALVLLILTPQIALASPFSTISGALSGTWDFLAKQRDISNVPFLSDALRFIGGNSWGNGFLSIVLGINVDSATGRITTSIGDMALNALIVVGGVGAIAKVAGIGVRGGVVAGNGAPVREISRDSIAGHFTNMERAKALMGIDWMTRDELAQAIPPAYTEYIGTQLLSALKMAMKEGREG